MSIQALDRPVKNAKIIARRREKRETDAEYASHVRAADKAYRANLSPEKKAVRQIQRRARHERDMLENRDKLSEISRRTYVKNKDKIIARNIAWITQPKNRIRSIGTQRILAASKDGIATDREAMLELSLNPPSHCPILGIELDYSVRRGGDISASPSIDRIDPRLGYVRGNIAVVSHRANTIKNFGTAEEHRMVADYLDKVNGNR